MDARHFDFVHVHVRGLICQGANLATFRPELRDVYDKVARPLQLTAAHKSALDLSLGQLPTTTGTTLTQRAKVNSTRAPHSRSRARWWSRK